MLLFHICAGVQIQHCNHETTAASRSLRWRRNELKRHRTL